MSAFYLDESIDNSVYNINVWEETIWIKCFEWTWPSNLNNKLNVNEFQVNTIHCLYKGILRWISVKHEG